jgi:hypothetical protein
MITYRDQTKPDTNRVRIAVYLDGKLRGHIKGEFDGRFAYYPKGSRIVGQSFRTLDAVKASIEGTEA